MIRVRFYFIFIFLFDSSWSDLIQVGPSRSELIRPGLAVRVDPVRLLYLPSKKAFEKYKPRGLCLEFYGNLQVTYITSHLPA